MTRRFLRRAFSRCNESNTPYSERLEKVHFNTLEYRRSIRDILFIHKCIHSHCLLDYSHLFYVMPPLQNRVTRSHHSLRIALPFQYKQVRRTSCASRAIEIWNNLPASLVAIETLDSFRARLLELPHTVVVPRTFIID